MATTAYIKLVPSSVQQQITTEEVKQLFQKYKEWMGKTGEQIDWEYDQATFPYKIKEKEEGAGQWFYLTSDQERYQTIVVAIGKESIEKEDEGTTEQAYIQISLPKSATYGDKGKATEFAKFMAKQLKGELHLFNNRIMYFYPRK